MTHSAMSAAVVRSPIELARELTQVSESANASLLGHSGRFVYLSTRNGEQQLVVADRNKPSEPGRVLTGLSGGVHHYVVSPDEKSVVFMYDPKGSTEAQVYRVNLDGSGLTNLTPGEPATRFGPFVARDVPDRVFFEVRKKDQKGIFVFAQDMYAPSESKLVFRMERSGWLRDVSRDGRYGLVFEFLSLSERALILTDFQTGQARRLYPPPPVHAQVTAVRFTDDGKRVLVATDGGTEHALLLLLDATSGAELGRYTESSLKSATISDIAVSNDGIAISIFGGNRSIVRLLDAHTLMPQYLVNLPLGDGEVGRFSADGSELTVNWSTPERPRDVYAIETKSGGVRPLRPPAVVESSPLDVSLEQVRAGDGLMLPVNVYRPRGKTGRLPVIVFVHGGPTGSSVLEWNARTQFFVRSGFAVVEPNIRGSSGFGRSFELADNGAKRPDSLRDLESVGRWLASQPWADGDRMALLGQSYGGYAVLYALATQRSLWRAGIDAYGISDWRTFLTTTNAGTAAMFAKEVGAIETDGELLDALSPLRRASAIQAPLFVYHGKNDYQVPVSESVQIVDSLRARGVPVELMIADDEGHGMEKPATRIEFLSRVSAFLNDAFARQKAQ